MRKLRVAYLVHALNPGGAEKQVVTLAERLPRERFAVDFLVLSGRGAYDSRAVDAGVGVKVLGSIPRPGAGFVRQVGRRLSKSVRYAASARAGRYDVVDAWLYPADVMAALLRPLTGTPVIIGGRRSLADFRRPVGPLESRVAAFASRHVDAIVANSQAVADDVRRHERVDPSKLVVIRNGVDPISQPSDEERAARRLELGLTPNDVVVACVANYRAVKGLDSLITAFADVVRVEPTSKLLLIGDGPDRSALDGVIRSLRLEDSVRLVGTVEDPGPLYGSFDVVVQTSRSEGLPNALLEAAAAGRPIVATDAGGTREIVVDGRTGLIVPIDAQDRLVAAILRLVSDTALAARLGAAARSHVAETFGTDRFVGEFANLYENLVAAKRRPQ